MCNIAGYVGNRQAAPILIDMMSRESGFGGGYYTGIATMHEGKLYYTKVFGDMDKLLSDTDAINLPGNIGFIHSRSYGDQNKEWAHPFISDDEKMAFICNGTGGCFDTKEAIEAAADALYDEGFEFRSAIDGREGYLTLKNGKSVHNSEINTHLIASKYRKEKDFGMAMMHAMLERPMEVVGLAMHTDHPESIFITRFNRPMMAARADGEMFLATTSMVFPKDRDYSAMELLPGMSLSEVKYNGYDVKKYDPMVAKLKPITAQMWHDAYEIISAELEGTTEETALSVWDLGRKTRHMWDEETLEQNAILVYETVRALDDEGKIGVAKIVEKGGADDLLTTQFKVYMKR